MNSGAWAMHKLAALFSIVALLILPIRVDESLPIQVRKTIQEITTDCDNLPIFKKGFIKRKDVNGDGIKDYILDYGFFSCGEGGPSYCGTGGCMTSVIVSTEDGDFKEVFRDTVRGMSFKTIKGQPAMTIDLHGSACGRQGTEACVETLYWNGFRFTPAH